MDYKHHKCCIYLLFKRIQVPLHLVLAVLIAFDYLITVMFDPRLTNITQLFVPNDECTLETVTIELISKEIFYFLPLEVNALDL